MITEDLSQPPPAYAGGEAGASVSTRAFTPPGKSLLLAMVSVVFSGSVPTITVSDNHGHTWTEPVNENVIDDFSGQGGTWVGQAFTYLSSAPGSTVVTASCSSGAGDCTIGLTLRVLNDCASSQTGAATAKTTGDSPKPVSSITPTAQFSQVYVLAAMDDGAQCSYIPYGPTSGSDPGSSPTLTIDFAQDYDNWGTFLTGKWRGQTPASPAAVTLGWQVPSGQDWAWCALEILSADVAKASSDTGSGNDTTPAARVKASVASRDAGTASRESIGSGASGTGANLFLSAPGETGTGNDGTSSVPKEWTNAGSADAGTGSEGQTPPPLVLIPVQYDFAVGYEDNFVPYESLPLSTAFALATQEGFSLDRVAALDGVSGAESSQLYGAQSVSIVPNITATALQADDEDYGVWYTMNKASITVVNGFMSWKALSALSGLTISSTGSSPNDYYGLPLWTQYQHNRPVTSLAFRMAGRNYYGSTRTLTFVLYRVQLSVLDFTGIVYKTGLQVSYAGTALFSSYDEVGNALSGPEVGRVVDVPGQPAGVIAAQPFAGV